MNYNQICQRHLNSHMVLRTSVLELCCFSAKHATVSRKSKDWLARNLDNVSEWGDMSTCGLLSQLASTRCVGLVYVSVMS
jgi:hypothetical protein